MQRTFNLIVVIKEIYFTHLGKTHLIFVLFLVVGSLRGEEDEPLRFFYDLKNIDQKPEKISA